MAKLQGIARLLGITGNLEGLSIYKLKNHYVLRNTHTYSKRTYRRAKRFKEFRKHQKEFGLASSLGKCIRLSTSMAMKSSYGSYLSGRLTGKLRGLIAQGAGMIGRRGFDVALLPQLNGFLLDAGDKSKGVLYSGPGISYHPETAVVAIKLERAALSSLLDHPLAGDVQLRLEFVVLSAMEYLAKVKRYSPLHPAVHGKRTGLVATLAADADVFEATAPLLLADFTPEDAVGFVAKIRVE